MAYPNEILPHVHHSCRPTQNLLGPLTGLPIWKSLEPPLEPTELKLGVRVCVVMTYSSPKIENQGHRLGQGQRSRSLRSVPYRSSIEDSYSSRTGVGDIDVDFVPLVRLGFLGSSAHVHLVRLTQLPVADFNAKRTASDRLALLGHFHRVTAFLLRLKTDHSFNHVQQRIRHQSINQSMNIYSP